MAFYYCILITHKCDYKLRINNCYNKIKKIVIFFLIDFLINDLDCPDLTMDLQASFAYVLRF